MKVARAIATPVIPLMGGRFSPRALFSSGEQGAWYDPSDFSTMFQDAAGTTPVTAVEQPVGLLLDKSKGLALGSERLTNGDFSANSTGWTSAAGVTISSGAVTFVGAPGSSALVQSSVLTIGATYQVTLTVVSVSGANDIKFHSSRWSPDTVILSTPGTYTFRVRALSGDFVISQFSGSGITIDNISVRELPGNHASQSTAASRPVLSARVNLLTYTEQFDNAAWTATNMLAFGSGSVANATTAPNGTATADLIVPNTTNANHFVGQNISGGVATSHALTLRVKPAGYTWVTLFLYDGTFGNRFANFNLSGTGASGNSSGMSNLSISGPDAYGFYTVSATATNPAAALSIARIYVANGDTTGVSLPTFAGDGSSGIYIWGADLRVTNVGVGLPAYQRVGAAVTGTTNPPVTGVPDYDTSGFPLYLKFDGVDDYLQATSFALPLIERMTMAGFKENAAVGDQAVIAVYPSTGNDYDSINGYEFGPGDHSTIRFNVVGSTSLSYYPQWTATPSALIPASVMTEDKTSGAGYIRVNGTQVASDTSFTEFASQSTGGLLLGSRWIASAVSSSLRLNGNVYGVVILGRRATAAEIASTETYMNSKTKAY